MGPDRGAKRLATDIVHLSYPAGRIAEEVTMATDEQRSTRMENLLELNGKPSPPDPARVVRAGGRLSRLIRVHLCSSVVNYVSPWLILPIRGEPRESERKPWPGA